MLLQARNVLAVTNDLQQILITHKVEPVLLLAKLFISHAQHGLILILFGDDYGLLFVSKTIFLTLSWLNTISMAMDNAYLLLAIDDEISIVMGFLN